MLILKESKKINLLIITVGICMFCYVLYRAIILSITYDEVWLHYLASQSAKDIMFNPSNFNSANNHILNSLLVKVCMNIDDKTIWLIRIPNVLSFILYYVSTVLIFKQLSNNKLIQLSGIILTISIPYVLDFYSLSRGYGLANAFQLGSIASIMAYLQHSKIRLLYLAYILAGLAVYSNFTWLNYYVGVWVGINFIEFFYIKKNYSLLSFIQINIPPTLCAIPLTQLIYKPILYLQAQDEFRWGSNAWIDSFHHFAKDLMYSNNFILAVITQILLFALFVFIAIKIVKVSIKQNSTFNHIVIFVFLLLSTLILITIAQRFILNTMYIDGRKAIMYFIFIPILITIGIEFITREYAGFNYRFVLLSSVVCAFLLMKQIDTYACREWRYDKFNHEVSDYISKHQIAKKHGVTTSWVFGSSFIFYNSIVFQNKLTPIENLKDNKPSNTSAYYYIIKDDTDKVPQNYNLIKRYGEFGLLYRINH